MYTDTISSTSTNVIPAELTERDQWVCWHFRDRGGKPTKVPVSLTRIDNPTPGGKSHRWRDAKANDPSTWMPHSIAAGVHARDLGTDGVGYVFANDDPYIGIDLDGCRDPETGDIEPWAAEIIASFATYCEVSPSGTGVKMIGRGRLPITTTGRKHTLQDGRAIEIYQHGRYFAITGQRLDDQHADVADCQPAVDWLWGEHFAADPPKPKHDHQCGGHHDHDPVTLPSDAELLDRISRSRQGGKFDRLWSGDLSGNKDNHSSADMALCRILAWWCGGDADAIDRLFRQSGLMRNKWERSGYAQATISKAVAGCGGKFWNPKFSSSSIGGKKHIDELLTQPSLTPLDDSQELAPGIKRPDFTPRFSTCRRNKIALRKVESPREQRISGFACRCHSCDMCRGPWEHNHHQWFGGIVQQFPKIWCHVAESEAESKQIRNRMTHIKKSHPGALYVKIPIENGREVWFTTHQPDPGAKLKTADEARQAMRYAIQDIPAKQKIGCSRVLKYEHMRESSTGEWETVPHQPPLTRTEWDRIRAVLAERKIAYTIQDFAQLERRNLDFMVPMGWNARDVLSLYREMVDDLPEVELWGQDESAACLHAWQDVTGHDGRTRRQCGECGRFYGYVVIDKTRNLDPGPEAPRPLQLKLA